jgi:ferric-dicitrate binding protein FerR (iron transport regulator)
VNETFDDDIAIGKARAASAPRRFLSRRAFRHSLGLLLALAVAWLVFRAYRQPDFLIDFVNLQLC